MFKQSDVERGGAEQMCKKAFEQGKELGRQEEVKRHAKESCLLILLEVVLGFVIGGCIGCAIVDSFGGFVVGGVIGVLIFLNGWIFLLL